MAQKRMFSLKIVDTDLFLEMPISARLLYYDLGMRADDEGFLSSPKKIQKMTGCSDDDMRILLAKGFVIPFDSGICVIRHWKVNNTIQADRRTETIYQKELGTLEEINGTYECIQNSSKMDTNCIQNVSKMDTQYSIDKLSIDKLSTDKLSKEDIYSQQSSEIIEYLNSRTGSSYRKIEKNYKHIRGRLKEGYQLEDFIHVIEKKYTEWANSEYEKYLRPETLFGSKFETYLNQKSGSKKDIMIDLMHQYQQEKGAYLNG